MVKHSEPSALSIAWRRCDVRAVDYACSSLKHRNFHSVHNGSMVFDKFQKSCYSHILKRQVFEYCIARSCVSEESLFIELWKSREFNFSLRTWGMHVIWLRQSKLCSIQSRLTLQSWAHKIFNASVRRTGKHTENVISTFHTQYQRNLILGKACSKLVFLFVNIV